MGFLRHLFANDGDHAALSPSLEPHARVEGDHVIVSVPTLSEEQARALGLPFLTEAQARWLAENPWLQDADD